ncbi:MAG: 4'-phosphopantetheinyl transferase superfamily protein, partial [Ruminococcaceae bacterium]|nr:4'-phosphopantetheinyl transferase superfamily protein [Oscillospiraceae bacterium]
LCFTKGKNRKWSCEGFEFSLSHSGEALAVVISDRAVGVDVERIRVRDVNRMAEYMLTESERAEYENVFDNERVEWLIRKWCQKEAIFKSFDEEIFAPKRIETAEFFTLVTDFELENEKYILAVASQFESDVRIFNGIELLDK